MKVPVATDDGVLDANNARKCLSSGEREERKRGERGGGGEGQRWADEGEHTSLVNKHPLSETHRCPLTVSLLHGRPPLHSPDSDAEI